MDHAPFLCFISVNLLAKRSILFKTKLFIILHSHIFVYLDFRFSISAIWFGTLSVCCSKTFLSVSLRKAVLIRPVCIRLLRVWFICSALWSGFWVWVFGLWSGFESGSESGSGRLFLALWLCNRPSSSSIKRWPRLGFDTRAHF